LQHSNPVDPAVAYKGPSSRFGKPNDPMVGKLIGGVNVFGGGLALYDSAGDRVGGVGVSGDTSCRDHMVAWETRHNLGLDFVTAGVSGDPERPDNIIFDVENAFGHPNCLAPEDEPGVAENLTPVPQD
jgi:Haem-degrading